MEQAFVSQGTSVDKGENARLSSLVGAIAIADLVKTTLGPKGLDKILQKIGDNNDIEVTNDGATILKSIHIDNPAAKILVNVSQTQDAEIGDGTTSVAVLCGELLRQAEALLEQRIHPQTICAGFTKARQIALKALEEHAQEPKDFRHDLLQIAQTTLSSKLVTHEKEHFANLAVDAVLRLEGSPNLDYIQIISKTGATLKDSYLEAGFLLDKTPGTGQPTTVKDAKILVANTSMDTDKIKIYGSRVKVDSIDKVAEIEAAERRKMKTKVEKILQHDCNVFINRQLIYNYPESIFTANNIMAIEHADFDGIERLAAVLGGQVVSVFDTPKAVTLGECEIIEQIMVGEDKILRFGGCKSGAACSIVLRGASTHVLEEAKRSLHDALAILVSTVKEPRTIYGGGCTEMLMAKAITKVANETPGKQSLAMMAFAKALEQLPMILADNGGYDASELVSQLRASSDKKSGLDLEQGVVGDMEALGIRESLGSKRNVVLSASEAAEMILRVDDIIKAAPRQRQEYH